MSGTPGPIGWPLLTSRDEYAVLGTPLNKCFIISTSCWAMINLSMNLIVVKETKMFANIIFNSKTVNIAIFNLKFSALNVKPRGL